MGIFNLQPDQINSPLSALIEQNLKQANPSMPAGGSNFAQATDQEEEQGPELERPEPIDTDNIPLAKDAKKLSDLGNLIYDLATEGVQDRDKLGIDKELDENADFYERVPPMRKGPWLGSCQLVTPDTPNAIDTVASRITESLFSSTPWMSVQPVYPDDSDAAEQQLRFLQSLFQSPALDFQNRWNRATRTERVDGTHFVRTGWIRRVKKTTRRTMVNNNLLRRLKLPEVEDETVPQLVEIDGKEYQYGKLLPVTFEEVVENHFTVDFINAQDVVMHPADATSVESANIFAYYFYSTIAEMEQGVRDGLYDSDVVKEIAHGEAPEMPKKADGGITDSETRAGISRHGRIRTDRFGSRMLLAGCARVADIDNDGMYEDVFFVMDWNTKKFLSLGLNPFHNGRRPYREYVLDPRIRWEFYGYSGVGRIKDLQAELDAITRQIIDAGSLNLSAIVEMEAGSRRKPSDFKFKLGPNFHDADEDGAIKAIHQFNLVSPTNFANRDSVRSMIQKTASADDVMQGGLSTENRPLGETKLAMTSANVRHRPLLRNALGTLSWVYQQGHDYCEQFLEDEGVDYRMKDDTGQEMVYHIDIATLSVPTIISAYCADLDPNVSLEKQIAEKVFVTLAQSPFAQADPGRMYAITEYYVSKMDPQAGREIEKFLGPKAQTTAALLGGQNPSGISNPLMPGQPPAVTNSLPRPGGLLPQPGNPQPTPQGA